MNNLRLQKRLNDRKHRMFYVIYDTESRNYCDLMEFKRFQSIPILERSIFKLFSTNFTSTFELKKYNFNLFKISMFLDYNIELRVEPNEVKEIGYKASNLLKDIYISLRWHDLFNLINSFRGKTSSDGVETLKEFLLTRSLSDFSPQTKLAFDELKENINYHGNDSSLLKECVALVIYDEYIRAKMRTQEIDNKVNKLKKKLNSNEEITQDDLKLIDEIVEISNEEVI